MTNAKNVVVGVEQTDAQAQLVGIGKAPLVKSFVYGFVVKAKDPNGNSSVLEMADTKNLLFFGGEADEVAILQFGGIASQSPREDPRVFALNRVLFAFGDGQ